MQTFIDYTICVKDIWNKNNYFFKININDIWLFYIIVHFFHFCIKVESREIMTYKYEWVEVGGMIEINREMGDTEQSLLNTTKYYILP